jgi:hypothetical protein
MSTLLAAAVTRLNEARDTVAHILLIDYPVGETVRWRWRDRIHEGVVTGHLGGRLVARRTETGAIATIDAADVAAGDGPLG